MNGMALSVTSGPSSRARQRRGNHSDRRPITIWAATRMVMSSKAWLIPPVGNGRAGTNIKSITVTAKARSANTSCRPPSVLGPSALSQASISSLNTGDADDMAGPGAGPTGSPFGWRTTIGRQAEPSGSPMK